MAELIPFKGLRYNSNMVKDISDVITPPYDIISKAEQDSFYNLSEFNSIRLELPKEFEEDNEESNKYTRAGETLRDWMDRGILIQDDKDCLYIIQQEYQLSRNKTHTRTGIIGLVRLEEFDKGIILPHENTLSKPKADRLQLMQACNANFSQVFGLYDDTRQVLANPIRDYCDKTKPAVVSSIEKQSEKIRMWVVSDPDFIRQVKEVLQNNRIYIADGHHRYETALAYRDEQRAKNPNYTGNESYNYVMMTLVDMADPGLIIMPTHRLVNKIKEFKPQNLISELNEYFEIEKYDIPDSESPLRYEIVQKILDEADPHTFVMYMENNKLLYSLSLKSIDVMKTLLPERDDSYLSLDVSILHTLILDKHLGIGRKELANQENLEYTHSIKEGIEEIENGNYQIAFFISPTAIKQIQEVSLANEKMPQKSTYFYPKLITGFVFNKIS